jgi:hypothetical protein
LGAGRSTGEIEGWERVMLLIPLVSPKVYFPFTTPTKGVLGSHIQAANLEVPWWLSIGVKIK